MVGARTPAWQRAPGIALDLRDLLALRAGLPGRAPPPSARRSGVMPSRRPGSGMDLREIRAYVPGDDVRRMDPSATARTGTPHVRALHEDRDDITLLIADFRAPMLWGTGEALRSVRGARHLADLGWQAAGRHGPVGLVVAGAGVVQSWPPAAGPRQMASICAALADAHAAALSAPDPAPLTEALARAAATAPTGAHVILATTPGGWQGAGPAMTRLARGRRLDVALILDPLDLTPPARPMPVRHGGAALMARLHPADLGADSAGLTAMGATPHLVQP